MAESHEAKLDLTPSHEAKLDLIQSGISVLPMSLPCCWTSEELASWVLARYGSKVVHNVLLEQHIDGQTFLVLDYEDCSTGLGLGPKEIDVVHRALHSLLTDILQSRSWIKCREHKYILKQLVDFK